MNRKEFNKISLLSIGAAIIAPIISFGKSGKKLVKDAWGNWNPDLHLKVNREWIFERYLKTDNAKKIFNTPLSNTVHEALWDKRYERFITTEQYYDKRLGSKRYHKTRRMDEFERKAYLVRYMSIEFQCTNEQEYISNKDKALRGLANLFEKAVDKNIIGHGCLAPCLSITLAPLEEGVGRELLIIWPCEANMSRESPEKSFNEKLGYEIFVYEGEGARIVIDKDGKILNNVTREREENRNLLSGLSIKDLLPNVKESIETNYLHKRLKSEAIKFIV